ncbi:hypothetical protein [Pseudomonas sp. G5(2012)]|nr:hypothetical protein [Pseudomonas sp. G5(2012)]
MKFAILSTVLSAFARLAMVLSADTAHAYNSYAGYVMADVEVGK